MSQRDNPGASRNPEHSHGGAVEHGGRSLTVVGGGVIGLTCALAAADAGRPRRVLDAGHAERASWVAGGMLGSLGEGQPGEQEALALSVESVRRWPDLVRRLDEPAIVTATDSLFVAAGAADAEYLRHLAYFVWAQQPRTDATLHAVTGREIRALEPARPPGWSAGTARRGSGRWTTGCSCPRCGGPSSPRGWRWWTPASGRWPTSVPTSGRANRCSWQPDSALPH